MIAQSTRGSTRGELTCLRGNISDGRPQSGQKMCENSLENALLKKAQADTSTTTPELSLCGREMAATISLVFVYFFFERERERKNSSRGDNVCVSMAKVPLA